MRVWPLKDTGGVMDIQNKDAMIAEIEQFKEEALKIHIVQVLADTYERSSLFDHNINADGSVIWFKTQARQLWDFWQAAKAQAVPEGFVLVPKEPTDAMLFAASGRDIVAEHYGDENILWPELRETWKAMIEAQGQK